MKILVIGSGGREHAIAWRLARSASVKKLYATPGNPGIAEVAEIISLQDSSPESYLAAAEAAGVDLTVVGPEAPLAAGVADLFLKHGKQIVGPTAAAAQLESSKVFSKRFMHRNGLPTAEFVTATTFEEAKAAFERFGFPLVLKADGLAAGKGVIIAHDRQEAETAASGLLSGQLVGQAGCRVVVEEFLEGEEVSFIALSDGKNILPLEPTQDHKAVHDGDTGPNTGGMGAYCDSRILSAEDYGKIVDTIIVPTIESMRREGNPFAGFLYAGLMMTAAGPKLLEFNVRLGDPEAQALMHRMDSDFAALLDASARGELGTTKLRWRDDPSVCVVVAAHGYPGKVRTGDEIQGIPKAEALGSVVFHAGTKLENGALKTAGGRVLGVTAAGSTLAEAVDNAYRGVAEIRFDGMHHRKDIGRKGLSRW
jgi:phosphoribosylamine--glycine ligase